MRRIALVLHRYVGLLMAVFLIVAGLTGSLLAFYHELDVLLNPGLRRVPLPSPTAAPLDTFTLHERLHAAVPGIKVDTIPLKPVEPGHAVVFFVETDDESADDEYFLNPYTGEVIGSRKWGDITQGTKNLMPFAYRLHYSLALGEVGSLLFGIIALLWTFDCFVGAYLTFPPRQAGVVNPPNAAPRRGWWRCWWQSWKVKTGGLFKTTFTFHRASGLWLWALLFVFAWSAVGLNLQPVYHPVMNATFGMGPQVRQMLPKRDTPLAAPKLDWQAAHARGRMLMAAEAAARGFTLGDEEQLRYLPKTGTYQYRVHSSLDVSRRRSGTFVCFDGDTGEKRAFQSPTGEAMGNTITSWLYALHFAAVGGLPYRILVSVGGVLIATLSVSGVIIWWVKRKSRWRQNRLQKQNTTRKQSKPEAVETAAATMPTSFCQPRFECVTCPDPKRTCL